MKDTRTGASNVDVRPARDKTLQQELEARTRTMESSITAMAIASPDGTLTYVNQAFLDLWREESTNNVLGRNAVSFWNNPDDAFMVMIEIQRNNSWRGELEGQRTDGSRFTAVLSASVTRSASGDVENLLATFIDVSDRVAAERALRESVARFSAILANSRSFVWEIDDAGLYTYISEGAELVTGYSAEELVGKVHYYDLHPEAGRNQFMREAQELIHRSEPFDNYENPIQCKNTGERWVLTNGEPISDDHGGARGYRGVDRDISESRESREQLRLSEALLSETERIARTGSWEQNLLTGEVVWSSELYRILEMDPNRDESSLAALMERIHPGDRSNLEASFTGATTSRTPFHATFRLSMADGTIKHVETTGTCDYDEAGNPVRAVGFLRDVTELVQLQSDLQLRTDSMEKSITGMTIMDVNGTFTYVNQAFVEMWGARTRDEVLGKDTAAFHEDPRGAAEIMRVLFAEDAYNGEFVAKRCGGASFSVLLGANVVRGANGEIEYIIGTFIDVTDRKRAEAEAQGLADRFRQHLDATRSGYWLVDVETRLIDVNQSACKMLGYGREELLGMRVNDIDVPESPEETRQRVERLLENGYDKFESRHRKKDGTIIDVEISTTLLTTDEEPGLMAFIDDISKQKKIERLEREREIAVRANQAKDAFLGNITHELRTPMNAIMGFAQLLQMDNTLSEANANCVDEIAEAGSRLLKLITHILEFTNIESGRIELVVEQIDCEELVLEAVQKVESIAAELEIQLQYEQQSGYGLHVLADHSRLCQVLLNLLSNAILYNKAKGIVELSLHNVAGNVRFTVRDTGVGIPLDKQNGVFTSFNRLGREALDIEGSGIGLVYSKRLVELMGGTIDFESTEGVGSSFWIEIPREDSENASGGKL